MKPDVNPNLIPLLRPMSELTPDPNNTRKHSERSIKGIVESLSRHGQQKPIVIKDGIIVAGNGTFLAARRLCWDSIAVVEYHGKSSTHYAIADNRSAELSEWDYQVLSKQLGLFENDPEGGALFTGDELGNLTAADWTPKPPSTHDEKTFGMEKIVFTVDEFKMVMEAVEHCRANMGADSLTPGCLVTVICSKYLSMQMTEPMRMPLTEKKHPQVDKPEQTMLPGTEK